MKGLEIYWERAVGMGIDGPEGVRTREDGRNRYGVIRVD
jgi:hypothetical protein